MFRTQIQRHQCQSHKGNSQTVGRERPNALLLSDPTNARLKFPFPSQETSANCCPIATSPTNSRALPLLRRMQTTSFSKLIIEQVTYLSNNVDDVTWDLKMKITHENYITGILKHKKAKSRVYTKRRNKYVFSYFCQCTAKWSEVKLLTRDIIFLVTPTITVPADHI